MDFARRQLEKYGWSDGKGLGKHGNGISEAIKPKIKRSVTGIGHDPASEFNEHWWSALYDKAAKNVEVKDKNGKTKKIKTNTENFTITNSTWKINKKQNDATENEYSEYFIKKAILGNGESKEEKVESDSEEEIDKKDVFMMTDEELFAACEGRTAHKGARHGLKAIGKLARIAEQEQKLITQSKYEGYSSHAKKLKQKIPEEIVENISLEDVKERKSRKKNKRKRCVSNENKGNIAEAESQTLVTPKSKKLKSKNCDDDTSEIKNNDSGRKINSDEMNGASIMETDNNESFIKVKKNKKRKSNDTEIASEQICEQFIEESTIFKKKKKKKCKTEDA